MPHLPGPIAVSFLGALFASRSLQRLAIQKINGDEAIKSKLSLAAIATGVATLSPANPSSILDRSVALHGGTTLCVFKRRQDGDGGLVPSRRVDASR